MISVEIISLGIGNTGSVANVFRRIGAHAKLLDSPAESEMPDWLVLPGVGSFDAGVRRLADSGWCDRLRQLHAEGRAGIMGICLGMQLLCDGSDEGSLEGLGLIPGHFRRLPAPEGSEFKVPHMGWNTVEFDRDKTSWTAELPPESRFYFVHSYCYSHPSAEFVVGTTEHGVRFASVIQRDRVVGFQFHPEKSHRFGRALLERATAAI